MIQRYEGNAYCCDDGRFMLFTDAEADKAQAVAEPTAELVTFLAADVMHFACKQPDGWWRYTGGRRRAVADRLVELTAWECKTEFRDTLYRPIESEVNDETTSSN